MKPLLVQVFKSPLKEETYLFVEKSRGLEDVPETLLKQFGEPAEVMALLLSPERKLARADARDVLEGIADVGFYLQMPPTPEELLRRDGQS